MIPDRGEHSDEGVYKKKSGRIPKADTSVPMEMGVQHPLVL